MLPRASHIYLLLVLIPFSSAFLGNDIFRTNNTELWDIFCVDNSEDFNAIGETTLTHQQITREGVKRSVTKFFNDHPKEGQIFNPPNDASLIEVFQAYYGNCASTDRFLEAVQNIVDANIELDSKSGNIEHAALHFDADSFDEGNQILSGRYAQIITTMAGNPDYDAGRQLIGKSLHTIQKFYSSSNWLESEKTEVCPNLGLPRQNCSEVLPSSSPACNTDCQTGDPDACENNLIAGEYLTSGYFHFHPMPSGVQKCLHGSLLDDGTLDGQGGINKATSSYCFSPHASRHQNAASMAIESTENFLNSIRVAIGDPSFQSLFELSFNSDLAILIDTSGSMGGEIQAVKDEVEEIIQSGITPSKYILAAYERYVDLTVTQDPDVMLEAVDRLYATGGVENIYEALLETLDAAAEYSDLIAFTDEYGDDEEKYDSVLSLALEKKCRINIIFTASLPTKSYDGYKSLCANTGGMLVEFSKVDVADIVDLLSSSIQTDTATLFYQEMNDEQWIEFPIDNFIEKNQSFLGINIVGSLDAAEIYYEDEFKLDLFDINGSNSSNLSAIENLVSPTLLDISFHPDTTGFWSLHVVPENSYDPYKVIISGNCASNFLADFRNLDLNSTRPSYQKITGQPVTTSQPHLYTQLSSVTGQELEYVESFSFVAVNGSVLHKFYTSSELTNDYWIDTAEYPIPTEPFYLRMEGYDSNSDLFHRILQTLHTPSSTSIEINSNSTNIEAEPNQSVYAYYNIHNHGQTGRIDVRVEDVMDYYVSHSPSSECGRNYRIFTNPTVSSNVVRRKFKEKEKERNSNSTSRQGYGNKNLLKGGDVI